MPTQLRRNCTELIMLDLGEHIGRVGFDEGAPTLILCRPENMEQACASLTIVGRDAIRNLRDALQRLDLGP